MKKDQEEALAALASPDEAIHNWFGLTYANYLVLNRSILQSMPDEWQTRFVGCLEELHEACRDLPMPDSYEVRCKRGRRYTKDPIPPYERGRTVVPLRCPAPSERSRPQAPQRPSRHGGTK